MKIPSLHQLHSHLPPLPVAAGAYLLLRLRQAKAEVSVAAAAGVSLTLEEEDEKEEEVDQEENTDSNTTAVRGQAASRRKVAKAVPVAGRRRRTATARQNKVWDPGRERHHDK